MKSDFISKEPTDLEGMINLYKNIGEYLGNKETDFEDSVPKTAILAPISMVYLNLKCMRSNKNENNI